MEIGLPIEMTRLRGRKVARATDSANFGAIVRRRALWEGPRSVVTSPPNMKEKENRKPHLGVAEPTRLPALRPLQAVGGQVRSATASTARDGTSATTVLAD